MTKAFELRPGMILEPDGAIVMAAITKDKKTYIKIRIGGSIQTWTTSASHPFTLREPIDTIMPAIR